MTVYSPPAADVASSSTGRSLRRRRVPPVVAAESEIDPGPVDGRRVYGRNIYLAGQVSTLMASYVRIRGDLLLEYQGLAADDHRRRQAALVARDFLVAARRELEEARNPSLSAVVNLLGLAERMLITLYRPGILRLRILSIRDELQSLDPRPNAEIAAIRYAARDLDDPAATERETEQRAAIETALKDAITYINRCTERELIEDDLQVSRLARLRWYLVFAWLLLLGAIPVVSSVQTLDGGTVWPVLDVGHGDQLDILCGAIGLSTVGAVGGVVSGMLNVRDSRATMLDYRTSLQRLSLKPLVGAVAALIVYLFLGAQVISGVEITSPGTYVVLAFVAGFSERYFLSILNAQTGSQASTPAGPPPTATPSSPAGPPGPTGPPGP